MNRVLNLGLFLSIAGFLVIAATGGDLVTSRTGFGLLLLGVGGVLSAVAAFRKASGGGRFWLSILTCLGSGYFIWRALAGGPIGLAIPDVVSVLVSIAAYLAVLACKRGGRSAFVVVLAVMCVASVGVALTQAFGESAFFVWEDGSKRARAVTGFFGHYNAFAGFLNGSVFFFLSYVFLGKKLVARVLCGVLVCGIVAALIASNSRGGWVSFIGGGAIWLSVMLTYLKQRKSQYFGLALVLGVLITVVGITSSYWVVRKISAARESKNIESVLEHGGHPLDDGGRLGFQQLAFEIFQDAPVIGAGPRAYSYLSLSYWDIDERRLREPPPVFAHNEYLQALSDYGLVGLLIIGVLILAHCIYGVFGALTRDEKGEDELSIWQIGAIGGMTAMLAQCFFSFIIHFPACALLLGLQAGILASNRSSLFGSSEGGRSPVLSPLRGSIGLLFSAMLLIFGALLAQSYILSRQASDQLALANDEASVVKALETVKSAGDAGRDPKIFEVMGRLAMTYASSAATKNDLEQSKRFYLIAKGAFESALSYNPHLPAGIAGLPRVEEALGNTEVAEQGHQRAMEKLWSREFTLKPFFYAAQSSRRIAFAALYAGKREKALLHFRESQNRLAQRRELLAASSYEVKQDKDARLEVEGWIAYLEASRLFRKGDRIWKEARPRNPELAHALMLEAENRYTASKEIVSKIDPSWEKQWNQLQVNLGFLKSGQVVPAKLSQEQVAEFTGSQAVLDSPQATR